MDWTVGFKFFAAMFAIMNPLTTLPVFLAMTGGQPPESSRRTAITMIATVTIGSVICALVGRLLLNVFGIDIPHFRLAGGLIVLLIALTMLNGEDHPSHAGTPEEKAKFPAASSIGVYPLGIPIAFGPGTMATVIVFAQTSAEAGAMGGGDEDILEGGHAAEGFRHLVGAYQTQPAALRRGQRRHVVALEGDGAGARRIGAGEHAEQRRLAGAVRADDADRLIGAHGEVDIVQHHKRAEMLVDAGGAEDRIVGQGVHDAVPPTDQPLYGWSLASTGTFGSVAFSVTT